MARYILATKASSHDRAHRVRLVYGNGLRPQIWPQFVERFNIAKVGEFYGATEGNANIMNNDNTVGAIGFVSRILPKVYPISIIRADPDTGEPIRNKNGLCQLCEPNEPGVFIGKIVKGNPSREFLGYVDAKASAKKIVKDVFKHGDMAFLSGDLLVADEKGYLYFKDRTGTHSVGRVKMCPPVRWKHKSAMWLATRTLWSMALPFHTPKDALAWLPSMIQMVNSTWMHLP